jgi:hypothetical protein
VSHPPKKLLDQVRDAIRLKHYSIRTEETYVDWSRRFILFHGKRHPRQMGTPEIEAFLTHLAVDRKGAVFWSLATKAIDVDDVFTAPDVQRTTVVVEVGSWADFTGCPPGATG